MPLVTQSSVVALGPATLSLAALFAALAFPLLVALLVPRIRRGLSEWAVDLEKPRIAVDVLLKAVTIVGVFAAINLFAFRADLEEILHCFNEVDVDRVALTYRGADLPADVVEAFDNWTTRRAATPFSQASVSPVSCVGIDASLQQLRDEVSDSVPKSEANAVLAAISKSSYQTVVFGVENAGRGEASNLSLVMPSSFELVEGPADPIDLGPDDAAAWRLESKLGDVGLLPDVRTNYDPQQPTPDIALYLILVLVVWVVFGLAPLVLWCWRKGGAENVPPVA